MIKKMKGTDAAANTREVTSFLVLGKGTDAAANTREVTSFLVWAHKKGKKKKNRKK